MKKIISSNVENLEPGPFFHLLFPFFFFFFDLKRNKTNFAGCFYTVHVGYCRNFTTQCGFLQKNDLRAPLKNKKKTCYTENNIFKQPKGSIYNSRNLKENVCTRRFI